VGTKAVLEDRNLGVFTDLQQEEYSSYISEGSGTGRFFLHIKMLNIPGDDIKLPELEIYSYGKEVFIKGMVKENTRAIVYDLMGRRIREVRLNAVELNSFSVNGNAPGIYMIHISGGSNAQTKRLYIE
jgi:hypothetical protein